MIATPVVLLVIFHATPSLSNYFDFVWRFAEDVWFSFVCVFALFFVLLNVIEFFLKKH